MIGCGVGASWGIVNAAADDFHEIAFAVPLLAFAATALGQGRRAAALLWTLPLVLVKEDLGLTVAAVGALVAVQARRAGRSARPGIAVAVGGVVAVLLTVLVVLPAFNPQGGFDYWHQLSDAGRDRPLWSTALHLGWPPVKWLLLLLLAATAGFLGLRSPLALLCLPTLGWRLASANSHYWGVSYHYSAVLMPLLAAALVDALRRAGPQRTRRALTVSALVTAVTLPLYPLHEVVMPETWRTSPRLVAIRSVLDRIPDGARVSASNRLAAQLTARATVTLVCRDDDPAPDWVVADLTDPSVKAPCAITDTTRMLATYEQRGYHRLVDRDGLVLLHRG
ncbi:DUF2079 domain-containing protein [Kitasatospora sp. NBC_00070]